jgi:hypothetical protein
MIIRESINHKDLTILNMYALSNKTSKLSKNPDKTKKRNRHRCKF